MRATPEQVAAMKARLADRQEQRRLDADIQEAINLVHRVPFAPPRESAGETEKPQNEESCKHASMMAALVAVEFLKYLGRELWAIGLVMLLIAFLMYGMRFV